MKYIYDPHRKNKKRPVLQPRAKWLLGKGKHEPLWDESTHRALVKELERRQETNKHFAARFPLSGLLRCSECGKKLHRRSHGQTPHRWKVFSCEGGPAHIIIPYEEGVKLVAQEFVRQLAQRLEAAPDPGKQIAALQAERKKLETERQRIQAGYRAGIYAEAEAAKEIHAIEGQLAEIEQKTIEHETAVVIQADVEEKFHDHLQELPEWIQTDDPQMVNQLLLALCEMIIVHPNRRVEVKWRP